MIQLENVTLSQGNFCLRDIDLVIPTGEYCVLMGPTGCGKTTILESVCGLRQIVSGKVLIDGHDVSTLPPAARQVGYVPQNGSLFPAMKVGEQIGFPLEVRKTTAAKVKDRVNELADLLGIEPLLERYPAKLSGGERQRVALARAMSFHPKLLCLDEPLSAVDEAMRENLTMLLKRIHEQENTTVIHVTHNNSEAKKLGSIKTLLLNGKIVPASQHTL
ncbi:MAG: ABC transporter ATP-binding protein [Mariniblastus sp.]